MLVCDEPTSGLDATSALEVITSRSYHFPSFLDHSDASELLTLVNSFVLSGFLVVIVKRLAVETNTICIATIHQPNFQTFSLFDRLLLLAQGRVMYNGNAAQLSSYLSAIGHPTPEFQSPSDHAINLVNTEFFSSSPAAGQLTATQHVDILQQHWTKRNIEDSSRIEAGSDGTGNVEDHAETFSSTLHKTGILVHRNWINYARNLLAFGIRSESLYNSSSRISIDINLTLPESIEQWLCMLLWDCYWRRFGSVWERVRTRFRIASLSSSSPSPSWDSCLSR